MHTGSKPSVRTQCLLLSFRESYIFESKPMNSEEKHIVDQVKIELERSEQERLIDIGRAARPSGLGISEGGDDHTDKNIGNTVLTKIIQEFKKTGCSNATVKNLVNRGDESSATVMLIIVDIATTFLSGPAVFTATASVLKFGIKNVCLEAWEE